MERYSFKDGDHGVFAGTKGLGVFFGHGAKRVELWRAEKDSRPFPSSEPKGSVHVFGQRLQWGQNRLAGKCTSPYSRGPLLRLPLRCQFGNALVHDPQSDFDILLVNHQWRCDANHAGATR